MQPKVTLKQRVWALVRNKPGLTAKQIMLHFNTEVPSSISSILSSLDLANVIYSKGKGHKTDPYQYFTDLEQYVPSLVSTEPKAKDVQVEKSDPEIVQIQLGQAYVPSTSNLQVDALFDTLSLNQGKELYTRLHAMFG